MHVIVDVKKTIELIMNESTETLSKALYLLVQEQDWEKFNFLASVIKFERQDAWIAYLNFICGENI